MYEDEEYEEKNAPKMPRMFTYRGLQVECVEINSWNADTSIFRVFAGSKVAFKLLDTLPKDNYFRLLVAMLYGLSITEMTCQIEADEEGKSIILYVMCETCSSKALFKTYATGGLFGSDVSRISTTMSSVVQPFHMHNVKVKGCNHTTSVYGTIIASINRPTGFNKSLRAFYGYGASYYINVSNEFEIDEDTEGLFHIFRSEEFFVDYMLPLIQNMEERLSRIISPSGMVKITYKHLFIYDQIPESSRYGLAFKDIVIPTSFNGIEIMDVSFNGANLKLPDHNEFLDQINGMNWAVISCAIEQVFTALMTDTSCMLIPEIVDRDIEYINNERLLRVFFLPHICPFSNQAIFYSMDEGSLKRAASEYVWLYNGRNQEITAAFPTGDDWNDPTVLYYMRISREIMKNKTQVTELFTSITGPSFHVRICAETEFWVYIAIIDYHRSMSETFYDPDRPEWKYLKPSYLMEILPYEGTTDDMAIATMYSLLLHADNFDHGLKALDPEMRSQVIEAHDDPIHATVALWETSVNIGGRDWFSHARSIREKCIDQAYPSLRKDVAAAKKKKAEDDEKARIIREDLINILKAGEEMQTRTADVTESEPKPLPKKTFLQKIGSFFK